METPTPPPVAARMPTFGRIIRWLFSWRMLRRCLVALAVLVTLIALFYTGEAWRGKRAWENYRDKLVAEGMQMELKDYVPPPVPDDQNFAMTPFLAPLFDFNPQPLQPGQGTWRDTNGMNRTTAFAQGVTVDHANKVFPDFDQKLDFQFLLHELQKQSNSSVPASAFASRADAAAEVLKQFVQYQPVLDELRVASHRPYSRFNIDYEAEDPASILLPHLAVLRRTETVLTYQSSAELATGKPDAAFDDVELMIFLAKSIRTEPIVISHLIRIIALNQVVEAVREGLAGHLWSAGQLQKFQMQLEELTLLKDLEPCLNAERVAMGNETFELLRKSRPNYFSSQLGLGPGTLFNVMWLFPTGWTYFEQLNYNQMLDDQVMAGYDSRAGVVHPRVIEAGQQKVQDLLAVGRLPKIGNYRPSLIWYHRLFASEMLPFTAGIIQKTACAQTAVAETALACALERYRIAHGKYPESIAALEPQFIASIPNDVITGGPLKYRLTDDGEIILYSVGWNETDDGGQIVMSKDGKTIDVTQGDWVWPTYPAK
jgi:hypothetical protein